MAYSPSARTLRHRIYFSHNLNYCKMFLKICFLRSLLLVGRPVEKHLIISNKNDNIFFKLSVKLILDKRAIIPSQPKNWAHVPG